MGSGICMMWLGLLWAISLVVAIAPFVIAVVWFCVLQVGW